MRRSSKYPILIAALACQGVIRAAFAAPDMPPEFAWPEPPLPSELSEKAPPDVSKNWPPPASVPGYFDPVARTFQPRSRPSPETNLAVFVNLDIPIRFKFGKTPLDEWATISCQARISYRSPNGKLASQKSASQAFNALTPNPSIPFNTVVTVSDAAPNIYLTVQCTAYDSNGRGYNSSVVRLLPPSGGSDPPVTFTLP